MESIPGSVDRLRAEYFSSGSTSSSCEIFEEEFEFESNPEFIQGRFVPVDLTSSYDKYICEVISKLAISNHNVVFKRLWPACELVEVVAANARILNSRILFKVIFDAIELCEGGLKSTYRCFAYHGNGTNELATRMHKLTKDTPDPLNPRPMNFEEHLAYDDEVKSSDGFDVTATPGIYLFGMIQPVDLSIKEKKDKCIKFARFAIDAFNAQVKDSKEELLFDELFKAMHCGVNGILYYLTFSASNRDNGEKNICQAIVLWSPVDTIDVPCFRLKTSDNEQDSHIGQWRRVWDKLECDRREIEGV